MTLSSLSSSLLQTLFPPRWRSAERRKRSPPATSSPPLDPKGRSAESRLRSLRASLSQCWAKLAMRSRSSTGTARRLWLRREGPRSRVSDHSGLLSRNVGRSWRGDHVQVLGQRAEERVCRGFQIHPRGQRISRKLQYSPVFLGRILPWTEGARSQVP